MNITMHRFFISKESFAGDNVSITGQPAYQITRVLRLKRGDRVTLLDDTGREYETAIESITHDTVQGKVIANEPGIGEPKISLTLYQALLKTDKFEFVLQKGVELGITGFIPFMSERCVVRKPSESRIERWHNIIREAAEQSRRARLPVLYRLVSFTEACEQMNKPSLILWEGEKSRNLAVTMKSEPFHKASALSVFVGPEGGFTPAEIELARRHGIVSVGLGNRILRAETAGLAAISVIMYEKGEMGQK
ncbi:MAG TPA: RsmE family RNA methyltransferase [Dehalococcoidales bacterium]